MPVPSQRIEKHGVIIKSTTLDSSNPFCSSSSSRSAPKRAVQAKIPAITEQNELLTILSHDFA
jgi:hypothetical protein